MLSCVDLCLYKCELPGDINSKFSCMCAFMTMKSACIHKIMYAHVRTYVV